MGRTLWATSANEEKVYSFNTASDDASLSSLTVSPRDIFGFTPDTTAYAVGMGSTVTRATVTATTNQYGATVSYSVPDADMAALGHQVDLSPGPNYVTVTVTAQDTTTAQEYILTIVRGTAIVLSVSSLTVLEGDATGGAYTVALATEPSETVTVTVSGQQNTDVTLGGLTASTLTFSDTDWGSPQSVTVTARDDADDTDDSVTLTHTAAGGEYTGVSADLAVTVTDDDRGIVLSVSSLTVLEGDATGGTYTVKLATEPSETVTVTVSGQQNTDVTLGASTLTFSDTDWASPQSVTVTARDDADGTDDSVTLTHTAAGGEYTGVSADLAVTVTDDDRGIVLSVSSLTVLEGDATGGTYTVALATEPSETVTVTVSGQQNTDVTLGASTLTFSDTDWASPQSVTVTARDDADGTDDSVTLTHTAAGGEYTGVSADLAVTVTDDDRGIVLSVSSLTVLEGDATGGTYTVKLATEPTETVTVTVSGQQNTDVTLGASTLTFSDTDWASPQSVTVTARDDADGTDDSVTLTHTAAGGEYTGVSADLAVTVTDDDRGIVLSVSSLTVLEGDATGGTYTVALATEPSETVTVTVSGQQNTDVTLGASTLTFSDTDWASPQSVTVTARDDADGTDDSVTLTHTAAGGEYTGVTADLAVTVTDDDRGIVLSVSSLTVLEGDATGGAYTVALATEPSETVTVTVSGQQNTDVTLGASTLTFSDTDWASPQSVTVTARDDADGTDDSVTLTHTAAGGEYTGVSADLAVTVTDDDRGIVLSVSSLTVLEGDATGGTYTVALATEPSETVTVTVSGQQNTDVTLGASTLTFSDTDWASPQSVTVTARDDADGTDDSVTLTHTAAGGEYTGVSADLAVTVTDDDRGIVLSVSSLTVLEGDATGGTYTVALATEPSETVTVTVSGQQNTDVTLGASTLTFSDTDWASPQSVTVTARDDADGTDDSVTLTHTAAGGEYTGVSADLAVTVTDDDRGIVLSVSSLTVLEGDATGGTYTVALATEPSETVTVTVSGQQNTDVTLGASTLTFSDTDWASPQSVTVTARDDADGTDDSVTLTHTAAGGEYTGVSADLAVTVTDDDRGIVLSVSSLTVLEGDATGGTYTVALATEPSETVTVTVSGQQNTDVTLGASTLTFSDTDWASPQSVTVTARDDADGTDDSVTLTHTAAGGEYTGVSADLAVTVTDDDRGIVLSVSSLTVLEGDATGGTYTVKLATEPTETVTVTVSGQQNTDVTLGASTLTFSDTDWASPQSVTVTARDDADDTDDSVTLTHTAAGGEYTGVTADLAVTVTDDDRGIVLSVSSLTVLEGDATGGTYTVALATEPTETVTVTVSGQQNTDVTLGASTLTFSDTDWASPQSVTVTARDDADDTDDSVTLTHTAAGGEYTGVSADLAVTVTDDDRGIVLSVSSLTVLEGDATGGTYTVALATEPSETVTVTVSGQQNTDVTLGASTLTFSDTDWASPQSVTVTARDDADDTDDSVTLTHTAAGGEYTGVTADLAVTVTDDDRGIVLSVSSLTVLEGDATGGTYTVKLATEPTETVTVTVSGQQNTDVTLGASTLTFSDTDWASPQSVTVTARDDADDTDDSVTLTHTAAGGEYTGVTADLAVTVTDDDRGIVLSVSSLTVLEGDATGGTYTVKLATEPTETVTVTVSGQQNTDVTLGASTLTFSDTDWASPQSVTVTARDDADDTDDSVTLTHTAAGGEYTGVTADLAVTVTDDDRGIVLSVSSLTVLEGDATGGTYTVKLATEPTETVTVTVSGQQNTDVTLGASTLTFSDTDWASPQSVTVTARDDADDTDDSVTLTHTAAGGEYTGVTADLAVTVTDDDRGIVLSVSSLTVLEGDATGGTYTVKLATEPTETVTVTVSGQQNTDVTLGASTLTFSDTDWASPQSVTVTARDDADDTDDSGDAHPHRRRRRVHRRHRGPGGHRHRRRPGDRAVGVVADGARGRRHRRHLHRQAGHRAHRDGDGHRVGPAEHRRDPGREHADVQRHGLGQPAVGDGHRQGRRRRHRRLGDAHPHRRRRRVHRRVRGPGGHRHRRRPGDRAVGVVADGARGRRHGRHLHGGAGDRAHRDGDGHRVGPAEHRRDPGREHADVQRHGLGQPAVGDGHRQGRRRRHRRLGDAHPHRRRRRVHRRVRGPGGHRHRRRPGDRAVGVVADGARGRRHRRHLHRQAGHRAHRDGDGHRVGPAEHRRDPGREHADVQRHGLGQPAVGDGHRQGRRRRHRRLGDAHPHRRRRRVHRRVPRPGGHRHRRRPGDRAVGVVADGARGRRHRRHLHGGAGDRAHRDGDGHRVGPAEHRRDPGREHADVQRHGLGQPAVGDGHRQGRRRRHRRLGDAHPHRRRRRVHRRVRGPGGHRHRRRPGDRAVGVVADGARGRRHRRHLHRQAGHRSPPRR